MQPSSPRKSQPSRARLRSFDVNNEEFTNTNNRLQSSFYQPQLDPLDSLQWREKIKVSMDSILASKSTLVATLED